MAVDSIETIDAAAAGGVPEVLIDVNVGLPRCGCAPEDAGRLADAARARGLEVRGVMGYEGHLVGLEDREARETGVAESMALLVAAHDAVGGDVVSGGGTGTWDSNHWITELQAGSYLLMDTAYAKLDLPFVAALTLAATVISVNRAAGYAVADVGLKSLGMDHGNPTIVDPPDARCGSAPTSTSTFGLDGRARRRGRRPDPHPARPRRPDRRLPRAPAGRPRRRGRRHVARRPPRLVRPSRPRQRQRGEGAEGAAAVAARRASPSACHLGEGAAPGAPSASGTNTGS